MLRITDDQWALIREHFPEEHIPDDRPGRKPIPARRVLEAVLWVLNTGAQWHMLPQSFPNYKTVHRRFQQWCQNEVIRSALTDLANLLRREGGIDESECYIDATFASAKGGGADPAAVRRGCADRQCGGGYDRPCARLSQWAAVGRVGGAGAAAEQLRGQEPAGADHQAW